MYEEIAIGSITVLMSLLGSYVMVKRATRRDNLLDISEDILENMLEKAVTDENMQKKVYMIGALLGKGIVDGTGLQKKGGKFGLQELIMQIAGQWLAGKGVGATTGQEQKPLISLNP